MATADELGAALINADKAGDTDAARLLAAEIQKMRAAPAQPQVTSGLNPQQQAAWDATMKNGWGTGLPKAAYELGGKIADAGYPLVGAAVNAAPDAIQMALGGNVATAAGKPMLEGAANFFMRSSLKPTLMQNKTGKAAPAVATMLEEGFNPTAGGVEKMKAKIADLASQVKQEIANSGATINTGAVADYVPSAYPRYANGPLATQAISDLGKVQEGFLGHPNVLGAREIPIQVAQDMKTGYQRAIGDKGYGEMKTPSTEGEKQIARGLRELIGEARPSVSEPLAREAAIIGALKMAERRVAVDANKNPIGLGWLAEPWKIPFWMWDRSALAKSATARGLYSVRSGGPALLGYTGGALYGENGALSQK